MSVKVLTEHHFEFLSFKGGCRGSSETTRVKMPNCWKSHVTAHYVIEHSDACPLVNLKTKTAKGRESKIIFLTNHETLFNLNIGLSIHSPFEPIGALFTKITGLCPIN